MNFDRTNLRTIRADIEAALRAVEQKHGITVELGSIRFSPDSFRCRLEAKSGGTGNRAADDSKRAKMEFDRYALSFGIKADKFGTTFTDSRGKRFTVCGIKPRSFKFPILAKDERGKMFKFPATVLGGYSTFPEVDPELAAFRKGLV